jgi:Flp pilus assembly protein TadD
MVYHPLRTNHSRLMLLAVRGRALASVCSAALLLGACAEIDQDGMQADMLGGQRNNQIQTGATEIPDANFGKERKPRDPATALAAARQQKAAGNPAKALELLQDAAVLTPTPEVLGELGRTALSLGQLDLADHALQGADYQGQTDWRVIAARGTVAAKRGQYAQAIPFYERAYAIAPNEPVLLNNLSLAYAANGDAIKALPLMKLAAERGGDPRIERNLELVSALQTGATGATPTSWSTTILDSPDVRTTEPKPRASTSPSAPATTAHSTLRLRTGY